VSIEPDLRGALLCAAGMTILGASVPISRLVLGYPDLTGQAGRYALATGVFLAIGRLGGRAGGRLVGRLAGSGRWPWAGLAGWRDWVRLGLLSLTGLVAFNLLLLTALRHADPAVVGTVVGGTPLIMALVAPLMRGQRPAVRLVAAAAVVIGGGALVHGGGHADAVGLLAALGTLAGEVLFSLLAVPMLPRLGPLRISALSCLLAVPMLLGAAVATGELARVRLPTLPEAAGYAYLGGLLTVTAFLAWYAGLGRLGPERAGLFVGLLPPVSLATTAVLDWQAPGALQVTGVLLVAGGLALGMRVPRRVRVTGSPALAPSPSA
jgi:drug/metabolite transporter (DMT)-like permease